MATLPGLRAIPPNEIDSANYSLEISISNQGQFIYVFGGSILSEWGVPRSSLGNRSMADILRTDITKGIKIIFSGSFNINTTQCISLTNPVTSNNRFYLTTTDQNNYNLNLQSVSSGPLFASLKDSRIENINFINMGIPLSRSIDSSLIENCSFKDITLLKSTEISSLFGTVQNNTRFNIVTIDNNTQYTLFSSITSSKITNSEFKNINLNNKPLLSTTLNDCTITGNKFNNVKNSLAVDIKKSLIESNTFINCEINNNTDLSNINLLCKNMYDTILSKTTFTTISINNLLIPNIDNIGIISNVYNSKILECGFNNINITSATYGGTIFGTAYMTLINKCNFDNININVNPNFNYINSIVGCIGGKIYNCIINNNVLKENIIIKKYPDNKLSGLIIGELSNKPPSITSVVNLNKDNYNITCNYINKKIYEAYTKNNLFQTMNNLTTQEFILANIYVMENDNQLSYIEYESNIISCSNAPTLPTTSSNSLTTTSTSTSSPSIKNNNLLIILIIIGSLLGIGALYVIYSKLVLNK